MYRHCSCTDWVYNTRTSSRCYPKNQSWLIGYLCVLLQIFPFSSPSVKKTQEGGGRLRKVVDRVSWHRRHSGEAISAEILQDLQLSWTVFLSTNYQCIMIPETTRPQAIVLIWSPAAWDCMSNISRSWQQPAHSCSCNVQGHLKTALSALQLSPTVRNRSDFVTEGMTGWGYVSVPVQRESSQARLKLANLHYLRHFSCNSMFRLGWFISLGH